MERPVAWVGQSSGVHERRTRTRVVTAMNNGLEAALARLAALPAGYSDGLYGGRRYGVTVRASEDGRRRSLYGEELGGRDHVSCNVYRLNGGSLALRPCEMPLGKVVHFLLEFSPLSHLE
jgi:hypothetical protein